MTTEDTGQRIRDASEERARLELYKQREQGFVASIVSSVTNSGGTINMHIRNPSDSDFDIDVYRFLFSSQFRGQFTIYDQFSSAPSGGSSVSIDNLLMDSGGDNGSNMGGVTANSGVSFTDEGSPHFTSVLPSGGVGGTGTGGFLTGTEPLIEPGREIVLELQNDATEDANGSIGIVYLERSDI